MNQGDNQAPREFKIKKKVKQDTAVVETQIQEKRSNQQEQLDKKKKYVIDSKLSISKVNLIFQSYQEIVQQSSQPEVKPVIKNIISLGYKLINDKTYHIKKQKKYLSLSNISQQDYILRQKEIDTAETQEISMIYDDIIQKLSQLHIKGFETREQLIERELIKGVETYISESDNQRLKEFQLKLVKKMVEDKMFNSENVIVSRHDLRIKSEITPEQKKTEESTSKERLIRLNPSNVKDDRGNQYLNRIFENSSLFRMDPSEIFQITQNEKDSLLNSKSDNYYNDPKFLIRIYEEYVKKAQELMDLPEKSIDRLSEENCKKFIELVTYTHNNTHYYQKLNIEKGIINPSDILYLLEKFY